MTTEGTKLEDVAVDSPTANVSDDQTTNASESHGEPNSTFAKNGDEPPVDPIAQLTAAYEEKLAEVTKEREQYLDQWRRSAAAFQNFKKREERLRIERQRQSNARLLRKLLPVLDDLQRGGQYAPEEFIEHDWVQGMLAIERKLWFVLEQEGVSVISSTPGTVFDPLVHEALMSEEHDEIEDEHIVREFERGYRHHEAVLRPARVSVAR